jgi:hypothetical protein
VTVRREPGDDDPIWEATVRGELDDPPDEADYYNGDEDWYPDGGAGETTVTETDGADS